MKIAHGHTAESRSMLQLQIAALVRTCALRAADVQAVYILDAPSKGKGASTYLTYYSYRYL